MATSCSVLQLAKTDFKAACKYIESGVEVEENGGDPKDAIAFYRDGIKLLENALSRPSVKNANLPNNHDAPKQQTQKPTTNKAHSLPSKEDIKSAAMSKLKKFDKAILSRVFDDVLTDPSDITFDNIAGNEEAKEQLKQTVIYPALRPELFTGLREPVRGILLFGPPGNGKTLLAKAVANESKCVFLNISAASVLSKWVGESERFVKTLFAVARALEPSIIFLDEVDALLVTRNAGVSSGSHVTQRVLTQFLAELDGVGSGKERILVLGATNRPQDLDDAALRRFPKRLLIPMPSEEARVQLLTNLLRGQQDAALSHEDIVRIARLTKNYSASDLTQLAKDAALGPIRCKLFAPTSQSLGFT
ncbi:unnamed protein product [Mesocestoides corti]|uniref:microtubule-severing ATPase n=2 Tax=Mesocestoides corti TaxID=53468 RepID=A0A158QS81_MESCO|nr:unnamed protein product [Mesocestoides corti]